jgi:hypothetical protein
LKILLIAFAVLVLNIPFGYWRANVARFSLEWIFAIHIPVPFIITFRIFAELGWEFYTFPILIAAFFPGQLVGGKIYSHRNNTEKFPLTSCLVWDIVREGKKNECFIKTKPITCVTKWLVTAMRINPRVNMPAAGFRGNDYR